MKHLFLQLEGFLRATPPVALATLSTAFGEAGGFLLGAQQFANVALNVTFELPAERLNDLRTALSRAGVVLFDEAEKTLASLVKVEGELTGQLMLSLIHDQPDTPGSIPPIPG